MLQALRMPRSNRLLHLAASDQALEGRQVTTLPASRGHRFAWESRNLRPAARFAPPKSTACQGSDQYEEQCTFQVEAGWSLHPCLYPWREPADHDKNCGYAFAAH